MAKVARIARTIQRRSKKKTTKKKKPLMIPTGSTLLNLILSDRMSGGFPVGKMTNIIGDSGAGKSILALSCLAEMAHGSKFKDFKLIYDDCEHALQFDTDKLFGEKTTERIEAPRYDEEGNPLYTRTVEQAIMNIVDTCEKGEPFIYILDSLDAISSNEEQHVMKEMIKAEREGKAPKGTYAMAKAKMVSTMLRNTVEAVEKSKGHLIIISQTRDDINPRTFTTKTRSGGKGLKFYCTHEIWVACGKPITKEIKAKKYMIGVNAVVKVSKNRVTGKRREMSFPIYYSYGIDDVTGCCEYLVNCGYWGKAGTKINAKEFNISCQLKKLVIHIEDNNLELELKKITRKAYLEIEESLVVERKSKYK